MTISAIYTPAQANGNDVAVAFPFTFKVFVEADLTIILTDALGVNTTQAITTDYTVSLNADQNNNPGGTVTMLTAPATGETLIITRVLGELQETDITNGGGFYPEVLENALDRLTMLNQQNTSTTNRALVAPLAEASIDTLPSIVDRASKYLAFDADGDPVATAGTDVISSAYITTLLDDADAATARTTLGVGSGDSPQFTGINVGHASDTTITRASAGVISVEGSNVLLASGLGVTVQAYDADTAKLDVAQSWTAQQTFKELKETVYTITDGAAFEIDPANGTMQKIVLGASRTPKATNFESGQSVLLKISDGTAYTITWTDGTLNPTWVGGSAPTLATAGYSWVVLWKDGDGMYASHIGDTAA